MKKKSVSIVSLIMVFLCLFTLASCKKKTTTTIMPKTTTSEVTIPKTNEPTTTTVQAYILKFESNGGSAISDLSFTDGSLVNLPSPVYDGYVFTGWFSDKELKMEVK